MTSEQKVKAVHPAAHVQRFTTDDGKKCFAVWDREGGQMAKLGEARIPSAAWVAAAKGLDKSAPADMRPEPPHVSTVEPTPLFMLHELLAIIHRDGGHYTEAHGTVKAFKDAKDRLSVLRAAHEEQETRFDPVGF